MPPSRRRCFVLVAVGLFFSKSQPCLFSNGRLFYEGAPRLSCVCHRGLEDASFGVASSMCSSVFCAISPYVDLAVPASPSASLTWASRRALSRPREAPLGIFRHLARWPYKSSVGLLRGTTHWNFDDTSPRGNRLLLALLRLHDRRRFAFIIFSPERLMCEELEDLTVLYRAAPAPPFCG